MALISGKKNFLAKTLSMVKVPNPKRLCSSHQLVVLNYHRISKGNEFITDFNENVYSATAEMFEKQMQWLKSRTTIISEQDLIDIAYNNKKIKGPCSMVTFDDGYSDNYEIAMPILKKHQIPATFFISTNFINNTKLGWWDTVAYLVKKSPTTQISINDKDFHISKDNIRCSIESILTYMERLDPAAQEALVNQLSTDLKIPLPCQELLSREIMSWDQVKDAIKNGITIGSHTVNHYTLAQLSFIEQLKEMSDAKNELEEKLGLQVNCIAYPIGGYEHINTDTFTAAKESNHKIAFTFKTGYNDFRNLDLFNIKRISPPEDFNIFKASILIPQFFSRRSCLFETPRSYDEIKQSL